MDIIGTKRVNVWFQKISIPPPRKGFFLRPPLAHLSGNSSKALYINLRFWAFENSPTPQEFPIASLWVVWIFSGTTQH